METKCENHCPNCNAGASDIEWSQIEIMEDGTKQNATCNECDTKFTEYYKTVYSGTEYDPSDFDNPYFLHMTGSERQYDICVGITHAITEILSDAVRIAKDEQDTIDNGYFCCLAERIRMLRYARIGVGDTNTDDHIADVYKKMLSVSDIRAQISKTDAYKKSREFYNMIHRGNSRV